MYTENHYQSSEEKKSGNSTIIIFIVIALVIVLLLYMTWIAECCQEEFECCQEKYVYSESTTNTRSPIDTNMSAISSSNITDVDTPNNGIHNTFTNNPEPLISVTTTESNSTNPLNSHQSSTQHEQSFIIFHHPPILTDPPCYDEVGGDRQSNNLL
ncbi:CLUMA_CG009969, isoform A [Clunio marinus]|uniref:CLUMA_CG009969, isoform A n=1 Tax=Clunio marinus TaxID=568069 RepID=A0A1J1I921_9DIPT|nr:CLUMA_CG009969, isoform A [Clunio marinus]